jgi:acrylyl-CoA reductase (NADPH)
MTLPETFRALVTREQAPGEFVTELETRTLDALPPGDVTLDVHYASLNYKDMLVASGHRGITRKYPHTPGIDASGSVVASSDAATAVGKEAVLIGYDLGMNTSGGLAERVRVPVAWVLDKPEALTHREVMQHGTAGLTAALCVDALLDAGIRPDAGDVLVTGARGGVGSIAIAMLAKHGFRVVAASRAADAAPYLHALGAAEVIAPETIVTSPGKPMAKPRFAAAVDTVGGALLFEVVKALSYGGAVAACGMAGGTEFAGNVYPFILRGVRLLGVDSVELPRVAKQRALDALATRHRIDVLDRIAKQVTLEEVPAAFDAMRAGQVEGRYVVRVAR